MSDPLSLDAFEAAYRAQQNPSEADRSLRVTFYAEEFHDPLLSDGGRLPKGHRRIPEIRKLGYEVSEPDADGFVTVAGAGRPIFVSEEMCEIRYGDKDNIVRDRVRKMVPDPRQRFPVQYAKFKAGDSEQVVGTLLREWGIIDRSTARSYEAIGVRTVEELAGMPDQAADKIRGAHPDRQKARDFLATAKGQAPLAQARAENEALRDELRTLREQVQALEDRGERKPTRRN